MAKATTEVATKVDAGMLAAAQQAWGSENLSASDILIPKILIMQPLSVMVQDDEAQPGELVDSVAKLPILSKDDIKAGKTLEIIPLYMFKEVGLEKFDGVSKWSYAGKEAFKEGMAREYEDDGVKYRRNEIRNFYCLVAKDATAADALPIVLSFKRSSAFAGKKVATHFMKAAKLKQSPASMTLKIGSKQEKNDKGTYYVFTVDMGRPTNQNELMAAYQWYDQIRKGMTKVDDADEAPETESTGSAPKSGHTY